ncbi:hypothetical protein Taro_023626 [Colocasia esculenta]|uniref:Protein kinase domain-containing protein n=1 Tax=Colocasia esculenta TaxID=4460 RepID=A0A843V496_COLES|nr:hypothetical protein [Colocasia esculenta]
MHQNWREKANPDATSPFPTYLGKVVVIRAEGPKGGPGMPKMLTPTSATKRELVLARIITGLALPLDQFHEETSYIVRGSCSSVNLALAIPTAVEEEDPAGDCCPGVMAVKSSPLMESVTLSHEKEVLEWLFGYPEVVALYDDEVSVEADGRRLYNMFLEYLPGGSLSELYRGSPWQRTTCEGFLRGMLLYLVLEFVEKSEYEPLSDVSSLSCVLSKMATGMPAWRYGGRATTSATAPLLLHIGSDEELPKIPEELSEEGRDFLGRCFVRKPSERLTVEMLLGHRRPRVMATTMGTQRREIDDRDGFSEEHYGTLSVAGSESLLASLSNVVGGPTGGIPFVDL